MNQELGFGYPGEATYDETRFKRLYAIADNKLVALLGFIGELQPNTLFLVYGRGTAADGKMNNTGSPGWNSWRGGFHR